ncbi:hypothetical protein ASF60_11980 [Methylobacterium sp. Leaf113]|uniref:hypothetical protein n=1 Tax=Methylobacterium sp. Leaf113 TaxID=1736259 RepID=UPI000701BF88|nr:hypothetical protein [Methylobacterium sp. Leaf113]KQP72855.1 hypothetical protein ASF60_11980 [Methylobacterium sp. Leaf113]
MEIQVTAGSCGTGSASYELGLFRLPDGSLRGVEDLEALVLPIPERPAPRRSGIARGLREALAATGPLPNPLGLAASLVGVGLDVLGGEGPSLFVELRFRDGATALIRVAADMAAQIERDRAVVQHATLRLSPAHPSVPDAAADEAPPADGIAVHSGEAHSGQAHSGDAHSGQAHSGEAHSGDERAIEEIAPDDRTLASLFAYEKRGGRVRRLSKALDS